MNRPFRTLFLSGMVVLGVSVSWGEERFSVTADGTVQDNTTSMVWMRNANCWGALTWEEAMKAVAALNAGQKACEGYTGTYDDWRLPGKDDLATLVGSPGLHGLILPERHPFKKTLQGHYWSSTESDAQSSAWYLNLHNGHMDSYGKQEAYFVWPVRGQQVKQP
ncbi:MAG: DUF1566 domain-containing protein [Magnetococcales bacterium]|nr:DUF1566 domain-containing protein [Magnetococcales bacterium]NGZ29387.1 DUF1566 domain-containing protein [Magnetococcales bacterium]